MAGIAASRGSRRTARRELHPVTLLYIVIATLVGGLLSVVIAASLTATVLSRVVQHLVSLSAGVLLGTALLDVLPEAFQSKASPQALFATLLGGLLFFFLLEKAELYRHSHHHEGDEHHHHHGFDQQQAGRGGWSVIMGDSVHNFCDGIIIAAAFLADTRLGVVTSLAIIAHEIPQEVGDYIVLLNAGFSRGKALFYNALSGLAAVLGGVLGYFIVGPWESLFPYLLVVAASSFIYVAVADLIPQLQHRLTWRETVAQLAWLGGGLLIVVVAVSQLH
jgi:zinc and cadmium transporter